MTDEAYDSRPDTQAHQLRVYQLGMALVTELEHRLAKHDDSKLNPPEVEVFDEYTPKLRDSTYGSPEYYSFLADMKPALDHHYAVNRHHPEFVDREIEWRPVPGFEGAYEVSSLGDVRSLDRAVPRTGGLGDLNVKGKVLKAQVTPKGYLRIQLTLNGKSSNHMVHRLVAQAFLPNEAERPEVNHINGSKADNRLANLEWATESENLQHAYDIGLREANVKYVVHCPELDLTTFGSVKMAEVLQRQGYPNASPSGIWGAIQRNSKHLGLHFEGTELLEYRRSQIEGMTLVDLIEMLVDWRAATERHADGSLDKSLEIQRERFSIPEPLMRILWNTAQYYKMTDEHRGEGS